MAAIDQGVHTVRARRMRLGLFGALAVVLALAGAVLIGTAGPAAVVPASSPAAAGTLYFTTYHPASIEKVSFGFRAKHLTLSSPQRVAELAGADGIVFAPDGHLLVGGVRSGNVIAVDPATGTSTAVSSGIPEAEHVSISPDGKTLYTAGEPGALAALPIDPLQPGHQIALHGATTSVTALAFGPHGQVLYTDSPPSGRGSIGLLDLATGQTTRLFANIAGAHGVLYDSFSRTYLVVGNDVALQISPSDPSHIESEIVLHGNRFDQAAVTGRGQVLIASNLGSLVLVDYSKTGRIGNTANTVVQRHLADNLDDVAPLVGPGAAPVATSAHLRTEIGRGALAAAALLFAGILVSLFLTRRRRQTQRPRARSLPRWDRRRRTTMSLRTTSVSLAGLLGPRSSEE